MARQVDALIAATLKNVREQWWDAAFSEFLQETLRPRPGTRILDVGSGEGTAELSLGRLQVSQLKLVAIDKNFARVAQTAAMGRSHNHRLALAAADASRLPFSSAAFDATFCVAVLQHVVDVEDTVREFARVTRAGGRVLAVEPDNRARYWYSSVSTGQTAFDLATRFFTAVAAARGETTDLAVGPKLTTIFSACGIEPISLQLFPVTVTHIGPPPKTVWQARRDSVERALQSVNDKTASRFGHDYLDVLSQYEQDAAHAGRSFVEIQNTMLFATLGQRTEVDLAPPREVASAAKA
jgi:SAM-dependent methyltransferase